MKAEELVRDALQELGFQAAETPVKGDRFQTAVRYANRLFGSYGYLNLEWADIAVASDEVTIPSYANAWAVSRLAIELQPQFSPEQDISSIRMAERRHYQNLLLQSRTLTPAVYPSTLPVGSGNEHWMLDRFYRDEEELTDGD